MKTKFDRVIQGDCVKHLQKLEDGCVDLVFADPPFNIGYDYDQYDDKRSCDDYLDWSKQWITQVKRVLSDRGSFWLAIGDEYAAELKVMATRELGFTCRSWVVWYYTFGVHCTHKFTRSHAHMFYFTKHPKQFTFNTDEIRVPSARQLVYGDKRANPKGRVPDDTWIMPPVGDPNIASQNNPNIISKGDENSFPPLQGGTPLNPPLPRGEDKGGKKRKSKRASSQVHSSGFILRPQDVPEGFTADSDTWYFPRVCGTFKERSGFHGCQMPEQLLGRIVKACSNVGDVVLDPFAGSGTTLAVAKKLGRKFLGVELSKEYVTNVRARLRKINAGDPLNGFENPLTTVPNTRNGTTRTQDGKE